VSGALRAHIDADGIAVKLLERQLAIDLPFGVRRAPS